MKLKKLLIASAVVAAVAGAMSTAAFAEEYDLGLQWNAETKTVTVTNNPTFEGDKTMIVIPCDEDGGLKTEINEEDIKQIDQKADGYTDIKFTDLAPGKYEVRIGGDGNLYSATFTVGGGGDNPNYDDGTRLLGDTNNSKDITPADATVALRYAAGELSVADGKDTLQAMDMNDSGDITASDGSSILLAALNGSDLTIADKLNFVQAN